MSQVEKVFDHFDGKQQSYIQDLKEAVAFPSMSGDPRKWPEVLKAMHWYGGRLQKLGIVVEFHDLFDLHDPDTDTVVQCPQAMTATVSRQQQKKTVLVYGHLDVAAAKMDDGWTTCPFQLTEEGGFLRGRGTCDNKGPLLWWLHAIEAFVALNICPPVNIKLLVEGLYESGSTGLAQFCAQKKEFFEGVECVCIANSTWLDLEKPCVVYGQRGNCYFTLEVDGMAKDICSRENGGAVHEPLIDLVFLLDSLQDKHRKINVAGLLEDVSEPTEKEQKAFRSVSLNVSEMRTRIGAERLAHAQLESRILMHQWRLPAVVVHGIEGGYTGSGERSIIPGKVVGKFSIQIVENQNPDTVRQQVSSHLERLWKTRGSANAVKLQMVHACPAVVSDSAGRCVQAAVAAAKRAYGVADVQLTRQGHAVPVAHALREATGGASVVMLCAGDADANVRQANEKVSVGNYMSGHKLVTAFMYELGSN